jgi:hypothetical protein
MNIGYMGDSAYRTVIEHCNSVTLGINEDTEAVIVEHAAILPPKDLPVLNTCPAVYKLATHPELQESFNAVHNIVEAYPTSYLYGFIGPEGLSDVIEMTASTRFLTGEIGPQLGFVQGTGLKCTENVNMAIPDLPLLIDSLVTMKYRGEIAIGITQGFQVCSVQFGHFTGGFALYTELSKDSPQAMYEWCLGVGVGSKLAQDSVAVVTLLSYPPFPYSSDVGFSIKAPSGAEKHLYRVSQGKAEIAYSAAWGVEAYEAKRRCRKTIDNCRNYNKDIQYRIDYGCKEQFVIDYGCKEQFVLSHKTWLALGGTEPRQRR